MISRNAASAELLGARLVRGSGPVADKTGNACPHGGEGVPKKYGVGGVVGSGVAGVSSGVTDGNWVGDNVGVMAAMVDNGMGEERVMAEGVGDGRSHDTNHTQTPKTTHRHHLLKRKADKSNLTHYGDVPG